MSSVAAALKSQVFEKRMAALVEELRILEDAIGTEVNPVTRERQKKQQDRLFAELDELELKMQRVDQARGDFRQRDTQWQSELPQIDFEPASDIYKALSSRFAADGGAALFLLQNSNAMGGSWYIRRLNDQLRSLTKAFRNCPIQFQPSDVLDESALLRRWGAYFDVAPVALELKQHAAELIGKIVKSLQMGSTVVVEVAFWDSLAAQQQLLHWFLGAFWTPLLDEIAKVAGEIPQVTFVVVLIANNKLDPAALPLDCFCSKDAFDSRKILELPLENWREQDIKNWLIKYSGLNATLNKAGIENMAKNIYAASEGGKPSAVYVALMSALDRQTNFS